MINAAILGFGTVGSGVAELLSMNADKIARSAGQEIRVKYILDIKAPPAPWDSLLVSDFSAIENDPDVSVVVETIGGAKAAYDFTRRALAAGKSVVTSNKELVAARGSELLALAKAHSVNYLFEASVGGGIPIIRPLARCLSANEFGEIFGILNGTTNYILTQMIQNGASFTAALKEAQRLGYAEANPDADVNGTDACRKICILASLAFGRRVAPEQAPAEGIAKVSADDVAYAAAAGCRVKLLGRAVRGQGGNCACYVAPHLIPEADPLARVDGVMNAVVVRGNAVGEVLFYGPGAGKLPTASAVVADVIDAARDPAGGLDIDWAEGGADAAFDPAELKTRWYVRANGTAAELAARLEGAEALKYAGANPAQAAVITPPLDKNELDGRLVGARVLTAFRVLD